MLQGKNYRAFAHLPQDAQGALVVVAETIAPGMQPLPGQEPLPGGPAPRLRAPHPGVLGDISPLPSFTPQETEALSTERCREKAVCLRGGTDRAAAF